MVESAVVVRNSSPVQSNPIYGAFSAYPVDEWDSYARLFAAVTTPVQSAVYQEATEYLSGHIVDYGCGTAKISPFLVENEQVLSYTGIDYAQEMVSIAQWVVGQLQQSSFTVHQSRIEDVSTYFTSAVSIQSYYAWSDPELTLAHIFKFLQKEGVFVLATPNKRLSIEKLMTLSQKELIAHPDWRVYRDYNLKLAHNPDANFVSMDTLVKQVQKVGFRILECHQRHFSGGLNFLVLRKGGNA